MYQPEQLIAIWMKLCKGANSGQKTTQNEFEMANIHFFSSCFLAYSVMFLFRFFFNFMRGQPEILELIFLEALKGSLGPLVRCWGPLYFLKRLQVFYCVPKGPTIESHLGHSGGQTPTFFLGPHSSCLRPCLSHRFSCCPVGLTFVVKTTARLSIHS